jgi:hypothetical protein
LVYALPKKGSSNLLKKVLLNFVFNIMQYRSNVLLYVLIHQYPVSDPAPKLEEKRESPNEKTGSELYMGSKEWLKVMTV